MSEVDYNKHELEAENSFMRFLILLQELRLSSKVSSMFVMSDTTLVGFVMRNMCYLRKPDGILVL